MREPPPSPDVLPPLIMVVDDDPMVLRLMSRLLQRHGFRVVEASSAFAAMGLAISRDDEVALLVSDVVMPGVDGISLANMLRARWPGLPVLIVSGTHSGAGLTEPGPSMMLAKPFSTEVFVAAVRTLLRLP